jgi:hypothetical protein
MPELTLEKTSQKLAEGQIPGVEFFPAAGQSEPEKG